MLKGKKLILSAKSAGELKCKAVYLRPKTPRAFKTALGAGMLRPARFSDKKEFEQVAGGKDMVHLMPDRYGMVNGVNAMYLKALIHSLEENGKMPPVVRVAKGVRRWVGHGGVPVPIGSIADRMKLSPVEPPELSTKVVMNKSLQSAYQCKLPEFILKFQAYIIVYFLNNLVVSANGTLVIDSLVNYMSVDNMHLYEGAKVIQKSSYFAIDVTGDVKGGL